MPIASAVFQKDFAPTLQQSLPRRSQSEEISSNEINALNSRPLEQIQAEDQTFDLESTVVNAIRPDEIAQNDELTERYEFEAQRAENDIRLALSIERIELEPQNVIEQKESAFIMAFGSMRIDTTA